MSQEKDGFRWPEFSPRENPYHPDAMDKELNMYADDGCVYHYQYIIDEDEHYEQ